MSEVIHWQTLTPEQRDALVAEKVMGREIYKEDTWGRWLLRREDQPGLTEPIPRYTQSLDAAWLLIEHVIDQKNEATVKLARWEEHEMCFWCMRKDELCHEICIAALRAVGCEVVT